MKTISFEEYDRWAEELSEIVNPDPAWWPGLSDIEEYISKGVESYIEFFLWLTLTATPVSVNEHTPGQARIKKLLYDNLKITE